MSQINETAIKTPGVYVNEIPSFPPSVAQVATAIPAFIGYTQRAIDSNGIAIPPNTPKKIYSLKEYEQYFGIAVDELDIHVTVKKITNGTGKVLSISAMAVNSNPSVHNLYYSIRSYFDNGGGPCYIVSVGSTSGSITDSDLLDGLNALEAYDEPTLILFPEGQSLGQASDYYGLIGNAIDQCVKLQDRFTLIDLYDQSGPTTDDNINAFRGIAPALPGDSFSKTDNLNYGAAYYPNLITTYRYQYQDSDVDVVITTDNLAAAASVGLDTLKPGATSQDGATYYACLNAISKIGPILPPTPAVAGVYARTDAQRGVWKSPANTSIANVYDMTDYVTDEEQESMNIDTIAGKSVNAIRPFTGKGFLVWGARTLDGNSNEWRYISVRRFFIMVEESVKKATAQFVFEPNDANTWVKVRAMIENYLTVLWRQGALAGAKPEHAFYVKVGLGQTMTAIDVLEGRMIIEIGMAAVRPAEFIILRFSHKMQES